MFEGSGPSAPEACNTSFANGHGSIDASLSIRPRSTIPVPQLFLSHGQPSISASYRGAGGATRGCPKSNVRCELLSRQQRFYAGAAAEADAREGYGKWVNAGLRASRPHRARPRSFADAEEGDRGDRYRVPSNPEPSIHEDLAFCTRQRSVGAIGFGCRDREQG